jgi:hypothetical protein
VRGNVSDSRYLIAKEYQILIQHTTAISGETDRNEYSVTTSYVDGVSNMWGQAVVPSCEQYFEIETPLLRFAGDLNRDGLPDVIIRRNNDKTGFDMLLMSSITDKGIRYTIAAQITYGPGC